MPSSVILRQRALTLTWNGTVNFADREEWQNHTDVMNPTNAALNAMFNSSQNTGGLEVYFVKTLDGRKYRGINSSLGIALNDEADSHVLAHEVLHQSGLRDIYNFDEDNSTPLNVSGVSTSDRMSAEDWGSGLYGNGMPHRDIVERLVMHGVSIPGAAQQGLDLPSGPVYGLLYETDQSSGTNVWSLGSANVGQDGSTSPIPPHY